ncbi:MAG: polysulfide reductase NrfD [Acidobacteriota bacterium]|nr:polysulfide reductase NrfD [Acidobacteriota bacterium]
MQTKRNKTLEPPPVVVGEHDYAEVSERISGIALRRKTHFLWYVGFGISFVITMVLLYAVAALLYYGVGIWGVNIPVAWGFAIANFVWWIGIGHAGTLISAILLLLNQKWRTSINRFAEAMTLFAVACAGLFPLIHLGRPYYFYWLLPYPNTMALFPQFRSPLVWDVFAVSTYLIVSLIFWYIGMIPDLATLRDRAQNRYAWRIYGIMACGWRGSAEHWHHYERLYLILAGLATPLVVSVHTVVSFDFAVAIVPGWHSTIFPPYFVAGAILSGFAMVLTLAIPIRKAYGLEDFITMRHLENAAKIIIATSMFVSYSYLSELFFAYYSGDQYEYYIEFNRMFGRYALMYWILIACNVVVPLTLWFKKARTNIIWLFIVSILVNVGMWTERYVIVVTSLHHDFMPSAWGMYSGTWWDYATLGGTIGLFFALFFLFVRFLPLMSMAEMRKLIAPPEAKEKEA